jgi:hypothetical protein
MRKGPQCRGEVTNSLELPFGTGRGLSMLERDVKDERIGRDLSF